MLYYIGIVAILSSLLGFMAVNDPETVQGITMAVFWGCVLAIVLCRLRKREADGNWLVRVMLIGLLVRFGMAFVHLAVGFWYYGGQLDFPTYHRSGVSVGRGFLQGQLGDTFIGNLLGFFYLIAGPGIVGMVLLSGIIGFLGSYLFLRAFDLEFRPDGGKDKRFLALCLFLLPSMTYWTILLGIDSWIFLFLGSASYYFVKLLNKFCLRYLLGLFASILAVALVRPLVGIVVVLAVGFAWLLKRRQKGPAAILRPVRLAIYGLIIASVTMVMFTSYLGQGVNIAPRMSLVEKAFEYGASKHVGLASGAASSITVSIDRQASLGAILRYIPTGMFTFLFRPLIFEAHNALAFGAALESTFILVLVFWRRRSLIAAMNCFFSRPFIVFSSVTCVLLLVALSFESNFGVIVRHRTMVLPFLLILFAVPQKNKRSGRMAASSAKADREVR